MKTISKILIMSVAAVMTLSAFAQSTFTYPGIYPFKPVDKNFIHEGIKLITEDENPITNIKQMVELQRGKTKNQPWMSTYWPLNKGLIADPYESTFVGYNLEIGVISWTKNYNKFQAR